MKTHSAVLWGPGEAWQIEEVELDDPGPGEVLVKTGAAGMCHSDEHVLTGAMPVPHFPFIGGHEGAGEVIARVGRTGNATTEHCHFEIRRDGTAIDPLSLVTPELGASVR